MPTHGRALGFAPGAGRLYVATAPGLAPLVADLCTKAWAARAPAFSQGESSWPKNGAVASATTGFIDRPAACTTAEHLAM